MNISKIPDGFALPGADADVDDVLALADVFGVDQLFWFLGLVRKNEIQAARKIIAARFVLDQMLMSTDMGYTEARRTVGHRLGYHDTSLSNFQRLADPGRELLRQRGEWPIVTTRDNR